MTGTGPLPGDPEVERDTHGRAEAPAPAPEDDPREGGEDGDRPMGGDPAETGKTAELLSDAPLFALLRTVAERIGIDRIERVWLFPPRRLKAGETSVIVVAAYPELDGDRRRVYAAHYTAPADSKTEPRLALDEFGTAPAERVGRVVEEVVERIKDDAPTAPARPVTIEGDRERWNTMLHDIAEQFLAEVTENPRLRR